MQRRTKHTSSTDMTKNRPVWGIRIDPRLKTSCQLASAILRIPDNLLVSFILYSWLKDSRTLFQTKESRGEMVRRITAYCDQQAYNSPVVEKRIKANETDDLLSIRDIWSVRGVSIETVMRIHVMALGRGVSIYRLIDYVISKEWEKQGNQPVRPGASSKIKKKVSAIIHHAVKQPTSRHKKKRDND